MGTNQIDKTIILNMVKGNRPVIVEIGAHQGEDSASFINMFPLCSLYLFEPDPRCISILKKRGLDKRASLYEGVVSDTLGTVDFYMSGGIDGIYKNWDGSGSIMKPKETLRIFPQIVFLDEYKIQVSSTTLDWYFKDMPTIDFLWMDTQGAEEKIFKGGTETLKKTKLIYTEFCNDELYEGAPNLPRVMELLPDFSLIDTYENQGCSGNALLRNNLL